MDINQFIQLVNGVGFPIATTVALGFFIIWDKKSRRIDRKNYYEMEQQLFKNLEESVNNNTQAINQMLIKLGGEKIG